MLAGDVYAAWHRLKSDEVRHFHTGEALAVHVLEDDGVLHTYCLGHAADDEATGQVVVPAGRWFAAECPASLHGYSLVGCSVRPGFEFCDFELAAGMQGRVLVERHPAHEVWVRR